MLYLNTDTNIRDAQKTRHLVRAVSQQIFFNPNQDIIFENRSPKCQHKHKNVSRRQLFGYKLVLKGFNHLDFVKMTLSELILHNFFLYVFKIFDFNFKKQLFQINYVSNSVNIKHKTDCPTDCAVLENYVSLQHFVPCERSSIVKSMSIMSAIVL